MVAARRSNVARGLVVLSVLALGGCAGPAVSVPLAAHQEASGPRKELWLVSHGWHTRVAVRRDDIDASIWPESRDLGDVRYLEVGWGDRDFYPEPRPSLWDAIDPVIRATPAALHVGGFDVPPNELFADQPVVRFFVPAAGLDRLARFIRDHYERDPAGNAVRIRPGYYPRSAFYHAAGRYHALTFNSNRWAATALQAAGVPIDPAAIVTAGALMRQAAAVAAGANRP